MVGAVATVIVAALAGCGSDRDEQTAESAAAETAETVCGLLRRWNNEFGESLNATSQAITDRDDPATANGVLLNGFDQLITLADAHRAELDELTLPETSERDRLLDELRSGADEAIADLGDARTTFEDLPPITIERQRGALGAAFIALEDAESEIEPAIGTYEDQVLREAFAANDGCEHVIQPF